MAASSVADLPVAEAREVDLRETDPRKPGRFCPADYRLGPSAFLAQPVIDTDCLHGGGGLYGNHIAHDALPLPQRAREIYAHRADGLRLSAMAIDFHLPAWMACFDAQGPAASEASLSYRKRALHRTELTPASAARGDFRLVG